MPRRRGNCASATEGPMLVSCLNLIPDRKKESACAFHLFMAGCSFTILIIISAFSSSLTQETEDLSVAQLNTTWILGGTSSHIILSQPRSGYEGFQVFAGFLPSCNNCTKPQYYFSVFFQGDSLTTPQVAWRANVSVSSLEGAVLRFGMDGNLAIYSESRTLVWETGSSGQEASKLSLLISGNLVLSKNASSFGGDVWASFENPIDALLPGQSLQSGQSLVSRSLYEKEHYEGYQGYFSLEVKTSGIVMTAQAPVATQVYQAWKNWGTVDVASFQFETGCRLRILTTNGLVFWFSPALCKNFKGPEILRIHSDGSLLFDNLPNTQTSISSFLFGDRSSSPSIGACGKKSIFDSESKNCGCPEMKDHSPYFLQIDPDDLTKGCQSSEPEAPCDGQYSSSQHLMLEAAGYYTYEPLSFMQPKDSDCIKSCLEDCACKAAFISSNSSICFRVTEFYTLVTSSYNSTSSFQAFLKVRKRMPQPKLIPLTTGHGMRNIKSSFQVIAISVFIVLVAIAVTLVVFVTFYWKNNACARSNSDQFSSELPRAFTYHELEVATESFRREIGSGGFGSVYEGVLRDGSRVAVKRVGHSRQVERQFEAEVLAIISIHHKNLVRLRGFCCPNLLVYEFVANGSLDRWLFSDSDERCLDCDARYSIALDIARGLLYLHEGCRTRVLHLDIKPQNILLDEHFRAKISDFGLSKQGELRAVDEMIIRGTPGYMAPEWLQFQMSDKLDIYSFGVVVLEMVTGKPACTPCGSKFLAGGVLEMARKQSVEDIFDKRLSFGSSDTSFNKMEKLLRIGMWCIQSDPTQRPSIGSITKMLEGSLEVVEAPPIPPKAREETESIDMRSCTLSDVVRVHVDQRL